MIDQNILSLEVLRFNVSRMPLRSLKGLGVRLAKGFRPILSERILTVGCCSVCGTELEKGYLFSTKDGAFSFADEVPGALNNARNAPGFTEVTSHKVGGRTSVPAEICRKCGTLLIRC
ncbi:PF20097 family protein [Adlercreutzia sp. ZJ154]|uniref:PF20097 family protein n=1 Tax=Adlercreutzia sp. ZJ154 TaxID=2709790 RepID=UPI00197DEE59|nr:PF20097 family protein [Adlercreutzia sp. ZJ154]